MADGQFSDFYVYVYAIAGRLAYVGKGKGKRAWAHLKKSHNDRLAALIADARKNGRNVSVRIIASGMTESDALKLERRAIFKWHNRLSNRAYGKVRTYWEKAHDDAIRLFNGLATEDQVRSQGTVDGQSVERRLEILGLLKQFCLEHILDFEVRERRCGA